MNNSTEHVDLFIKTPKSHFRGFYTLLNSIIHLFSNLGHLQMAPIPATSSTLRHPVLRTHSACACSNSQRLATLQTAQVRGLLLKLVIPMSIKWDG